MSDIVLINPPLSLKERYGSFSASGTVTSPIGLCYLASSLIVNGIKTEILDASALKIDCDETVKNILKISPKYIGITTVSLSMKKTIEIADKIKKIQSNIKIIIGGAQLTALPEETMLASSAFDIGIIGEGEKTIVELFKDLKNIPGLIFPSTENSNSFIKTNPRLFISDLDTLPMPAWHLLPKIKKYYQPAAISSKYLPSFSLITSRGCPAKCIFCDKKVFGNTFRCHSDNYIIDMMRYLKRHHDICDITFADDTFTIFKDRIINLCNSIIKSNIKMTWSCNTRIDELDAEILKVMKSAGCWQINLGIESASQKILNTLGKEITIERVSKILKDARKIGIRTRGYFMIGNPEETEETIKETIKFITAEPLDDFQLTFFTPLPGSAIYNTAPRYGEFTQTAENLNYWFPTFVPYGLSKQKLLNYFNLAYKKFYFRPKIIISYIIMLRSPKQFLRLLRGMFSIIKINKD